MYSTYCYSGSNSYSHVTEVTCDIDDSGRHSECTVLTVTVRVGSDPHRHVTEVTYAIYIVSFTKRFHFQHSAATPFLHTCKGTFAHPAIFGAQEYHSGSMEKEDIRQNMHTDHKSLVTGFYIRGSNATTHKGLQTTGNSKGMLDLQTVKAVFDAQQTMEY